MSEYNISTHCKEKLWLVWGSRLFSLLYSYIIKNSLIRYSKLLTINFLRYKIIAIYCRGAFLYEFLFSITISWPTRNSRKLTKQQAFSFYLKIYWSSNMTLSHSFIIETNPETTSEWTDISKKGFVTNSMPRIPVWKRKQRNRQRAGLEIRFLKLLLTYEIPFINFKSKIQDWSPSILFDKNYLNQLTTLDNSFINMDIFVLSQNVDSVLKSRIYATSYKKLVLVLICELLANSEIYTSAWTTSQFFSPNQNF